MPMKSVIIKIILGVTLALPIVAIASAHHSTSEFNYAKQVLLKGVVKEVQWTNPHSYLQVLVDGENGDKVQWGIEIGSPSLNIRSGWKKDSVKRGDEVSLDIAPARNGSNFGTLRVLTLKDGRTFKGIAASINPDRNGTPILK
jgi:hypothetical protein